MTLDDFKKLSSPSDDFSPELKALWHDFQGDWTKAHDQVDHLDGKSAARVHAYLHRKEGDQWNADYWYRRAGEARTGVSLEQEWEELAKRFLAV